MQAGSLVVSNMNSKLLILEGDSISSKIDLSRQRNMQKVQTQEKPLGNASVKKD